MCVDGRSGVGGVGEFQALIEKELKSNGACWWTLCL